MRRDWEPEDLVACWTLVDADWRLVANKSGATRLGFALLLKFFEQEARFPRHIGELPPAAVDYIGAQTKVDPGQLAKYDWSGRTIKYHRGQIRDALGFREAARADEEALTAWLAEEVAPAELSEDRLRESLVAHCRAEHIEPPGRIERIVGAARAAASDQFCATTLSRLGLDAADRLEELVVDHDDESNGGHGVLAELKADPGHVSLESLLNEIDKLERIRSLRLPLDLFVDATEPVIGAWRARAAQEYPSDLRERPRPVRLTLLAALCWVRTGEITDGLVELLIGVVHKIGTRAENRVEGELLADLRRVRGKQAILFRLAEAAVEHPDETVRRALFPVVGEATLRGLVAEAKANEVAFKTRVRTVLRSSYSSYYRRMLPRLLGALQFRSNNTAHQPIIEALDLLRRYADRPGTVRYYASEEAVPLAGVVSADWQDAVADERGRVERIAYELCVLRTLRDGLRRREVWVVGANRWRDPEADLPADFEANRTVRYTALRQPLDPSTFIDELRQRMRSALTSFDAAVKAEDTGGVRFLTRNGEPWISVPKPEKLTEPANLERLKKEVERCFGTIDLLDFLKEADYLTDLTGPFASVASREVTPRDVVRRRLLLVLFGLGTNIGIKQIAAGEHGETEAALRRVRWLYLNRDSMRQAIVRVVNATFSIRDAGLWGTGTACASDSKKFGSWESNLMTEWHARYRGPGVMIYWHVEKNSVCIYSQLKSCSSSEVAAMIEGLLRHCTDADMDRNYVDTHGQSAVGFAFTYLLGFTLLPRLKNIGSARLYRPDADNDAFPNLGPVLTRPIRWDLIAQQYDQMVKYATALRLGTAEAEAILRRFTRPGPQHPTYQALVELGRAVKTSFLADYLRMVPLRREVHEGLQVVENWNSANAVLCYGKASELTGPDREDQEITMLALHLLQSALVYINTIFLQRVLAGPEWSGRLTEEDHRALTPLFWTHVNPYGTFSLQMDPTSTSGSQKRRDDPRYFAPGDSFGSTGPSRSARPRADQDGPGVAVPRLRHIGASLPTRTEHSV